MTPTVSVATSSTDVNVADDTATIDALRSVQRKACGLRMPAGSRTSTQRIGDDSRDNVTAIAHARKPADYASYTGRKSLAGKRLGVVRDFMIEATLADRDSVRIGNEALANIKQLGATVVDPVDFSGAIAEIMTAYEPSFFTQTFPVAVPSGVRPINRLAVNLAPPAPSTASSPLAWPSPSPWPHYRRP